MRVEAGYLSRLAAEQFGHRDALTWSGRTQTFAELNARANQVGSGARAAGIGLGARVGVLSFNRSEVVESWLGLEKHGIVRVVLHSHFAMEAHVASLNHVGAEGLFFDTAFADQVDSVRDRLSTVRLFVAIGDGCPDWAVPY